MSWQMHEHMRSGTGLQTPGARVRGSWGRGGARALRKAGPSADLGAGSRGAEQARGRMQGDHSPEGLETPWLPEQTLGPASGNPDLA
jgi:hypothetical protein